jgi:stage II sporulation protein D
VTAIEDERRLPSERLGGVTFKATRGEKRVSGAELRSLLGEKALSTWFTRLALEGDSLVAEGRGYGHGAGLCQVGARTLANAGEDWRAILAYYYPGAVVAYLYPPSG